MRVLVTSGGGAKGAFTVGALKYLRDVQHINQFDLISGTSTGALIATLTAIGDLDTLLRIYSNTKNRDTVLPNNMADVLIGGGKAIFNTDPLLEQINNKIDQTVFEAIMRSTTNLCLNATSLQTGKINVFSTKPISASPRYISRLIADRDMMTAAMLGSSNQPAFTPPVRIAGEDFVDGGTREVIPTRVVINNLDATQSHDIYVISNNPNEIVPFTDNQVSDLLGILLRTISIFVQEVRENDLEVLATFRDKATATGAQVRIFYICPDLELDPDFATGLRFDKIKMARWMIKGQLMAKTVIENNPNGNFTGRRAF